VRRTSLQVAEAPCTSVARQDHRVVHRVQPAEAELGTTVLAHTDLPCRMCPTRESRCTSPEQVHRTSHLAEEALRTVLHQLAVHPAQAQAQAQAQRLAQVQAQVQLQAAVRTSTPRVPVHCTPLRLPVARRDQAQVQAALHTRHCRSQDQEAPEHTSSPRTTTMSRKEPQQQGRVPVAVRHTTTTTG
jgi:hypothetical protein